jgi:hypothetical protein
LKASASEQPIAERDHHGFDLYRVPIEHDLYRGWTHGQKYGLEHSGQIEGHPSQVFEFHTFPDGDAIKACAGDIAKVTGNASIHRHLTKVEGMRRPFCYEHAGLLDVRRHAIPDGKVVSRSGGNAAKRCGRVSVTMGHDTIDDLMGGSISADGDNRPKACGDGLLGEEDRFLWPSRAPFWCNKT